MVSIRQRIKRAWNVFAAQEEQTYRPPTYELGTSYGIRPDRLRLYSSSEKSIVSSVITRIGIDVAAVRMLHCKLDEQGRFSSEMVSGLNNCLTLEANIDQGATALRQDIVMTMLDKGVVAVVPVDTSDDPLETGSYDILTMRVGEIVQWYPQHVRVKLYDDRTGRKQELVLHKRDIAIIENPLYEVMNSPNSTLQRLIRKLNILDAIDEQSGSGRLDLIIQLPYVIKSETRKQQAEQRRKDIEVQLKDSQYGIAYVDGTEKITQLNRPAENNLLKQIEFLTGMLYGQLGITEEVFNGTASEEVMLNYHNRTVKPILKAITEAFNRSFLTKTARTQGQSVEFFRDPFELVAISSIAEIADKFTRNEILTSNEVRAIIGFKPVSDAKADRLQNKNIPPPTESTPDLESDNQNGT